MNITHIMGESYTLDHLKFEIGELVTNIVGEYGIIVGFGRHIKYPESDNCNYYHVLIGGYVSCYLPYSLQKVEKNKKNT
jgi:hypothetical protein